ncbi:MAG: prepilin-type N-terminal cleavage/methylation domain-containing protein [Pseudomonadota bacterium]
MIHAGSSGRAADAGVTLIEMLVVLTLFAVVSSAVVMSLPTRGSSGSAKITAISLAAQIERAIGLALAENQGFGIGLDDGQLRFLQRSKTGEWRAHAHPHLAQVKLFPVNVRFLEQDKDAAPVFAVSARLIPELGQPLRLAFGDPLTGSNLNYDGVTVRLEHGEGDSGAS